MPKRKVRIDEIEILRYEWPYLEIRCKRCQAERILGH